MNILCFFLGALFGGTVGVVTMCLMMVSGDRKN
jgi:hypothetical protein